MPRNNVRKGKPPPVVADSIPVLVLPARATMVCSIRRSLDWRDCKAYTRLIETAVVCPKGRNMGHCGAGRQMCPASNEIEREPRTAREVARYGGEHDEGALAPLVPGEAVAAADGRRKQADGGQARQREERAREQGDGRLDDLARESAGRIADGDLTLGELGVHVHP